MEWILKCYATMYIQQKSLKKNLCLFLKSAEKEKMLEIFKQIPKSPI